MFKCNQKMNYILQGVSLDTIEADHSYPITRRTTSTGDFYWSVNKEKAPIHFSGLYLTDYEWTTNEVFINDSKNLVELVLHGLCIIKAWQSEMSEQWPSTQFDVILSVDYGDDVVEPNVTLRFWAVRDDYHYVQLQKENLEKFEMNAVLAQCVNYRQ